MTTKHVKRSKTWHVGLWIVQILVGGMFLMAGFQKAFTPLEELARLIPMAGDWPGLTRFIGISELAGGLGLLLPAALRIRPQLTTLAAAALGLVMLLALLYHVSRGEYPGTVLCGVLGALAVLIAWGRTYKAPIAQRVAKADSAINT